MATTSLRFPSDIDSHGFGKVFQEYVSKTPTGRLALEYNNLVEESGAVGAEGEEIPIAQMGERMDGLPSSEGFVDTVCQDVLVKENVQNTIDVVDPDLLGCSADKETKHSETDSHVESTGQRKEKKKSPPKSSLRSSEKKVKRFQQRFKPQTMPR